MALTKNQKSLCNKMISDFDSLVQPGKSAKGSLNSASNGMRSQLNEIKGNFHPASELENELSSFQNKIADSLPGDTIDDLREIKSFMDNCDYLKDLNPLSVVLGTIVGVFDEIDNLLDDIGLSFPEFNAGGLGSIIDKILDGINIPGGDKLTELLRKADELIQCVEEKCGPEYSGRVDGMIDELDSVYTDLGLISTGDDKGLFDYTKLYGEVGLSPDEVGIINNLKSGINTSKDSSTEAIDKSVASIKNAKKLGELI